MKVKPTKLAVHDLGEIYIGRAGVCASTFHNLRYGFEHVEKNMAIGLYNCQFFTAGRGDAKHVRAVRVVSASGPAAILAERLVRNNQWDTAVGELILEGDFFFLAYPTLSLYETDRIELQRELSEEDCIAVNEELGDGDGFGNRGFFVRLPFARNNCKIRKITAAGQVIALEAKFEEATPNGSH